jgi:hypothetical protein
MYKMQKWFSSILTNLQHETIEAFPVVSIFDGVLLPKHQIAIHFVSATHQLNTLQNPFYFQNISALCKEQNIQCVHVWQDRFIQKPEVIMSRLLSVIGKSKRIHGRDTEVKRIDKTTSDSFLETHHLQGKASAYYKYGLYKKNQLLAVATFSKSRIMTDGSALYRSYELVRFACANHTTIVGGLGKLIKHFISETQPAHIMTYVDKDWGNGKGYIALGFKQIETTQPLLFYINTQTMERVLPKMIDEQTLQNEQWLASYTSGNYKFVWQP